MDLIQVWHQVFQILIKMVRIILYIVTFLTGYLAFAQVGINTSTPSAMLEVNGDTKLDEKLYLEDPGDNLEIRGAKLLIERSDNSIVQYDIDKSKYGPINYAKLVFENTSKNGITDYDTKISTTDYIVGIQGYYFRGYSDGNTSIVSQSSVSTNDIEGFQVYAYKNLVTNTWFIRASVNNSIFRRTDNANITVNIYMNVFIFRTGFISKESPSLDIDMGLLPIKTVSKPTGF